MATTTARHARVHSLAVLAALLAASPAAGRAAAPDPLPLEPHTDAEVVGAEVAVAAALALASSRLGPSHCRLCGLDGLDEEANELLRSDGPRAAATTSDVLANAVIPGAALLGLVGSAWADGAARQGLADAVPVLEAVLLATDVELATKSVSARYRPSAGRTGRGNALRSFFSGHTTLAFSVAVSSAEVATLRGRRAAPWFWGIGLALATAVGWTRMAANAHWLTDVVAGAAVGGTAGMVVPLWVHRRAHGPPVMLRGAPGGLALEF